MTATTYRPLRYHLLRNQILFLAAGALVIALLAYGTRVVESLRRETSKTTAQIAATQPRPQVVPPVVVPSASNAELKMFTATAPASPAPLVLSFHDISPHPRGPYTVTPAAFATQLATLRAAGFRSLTARDFGRARGVVPTTTHRTVLLTFDDGAAGLWRYADAILREYDFHAVAFVITGDLTPMSNGYYLSWSELQAMHHSGRWDVESHSDHGHGLVSTGTRARPAPFFANRQWLLSRHRYETLNEFKTRIEADLDRVDSRLVAHHIPKATLFAHPRSAGIQDSDDPRTLLVLQNVLDARYDASFSNADLAIPLVGSLHGRTLPRMEVVRSDEPAQVWDRIRRSAPSGVVAGDVLADDGRWADEQGRTVNALALSHRLPIKPTKTSTRAHFMPGASATWARYEVDASIEGLDAMGTNLSAGVTVLDASPAPFRVDVSSQRVRVSQGSDEHSKVLLDQRLPLATSRDLKITVADGALSVTVNGRKVLAVKASPETSSYAGGVGIQSWRADRSLLLPTFAGLTIKPL